MSTLSGIGWIARGRFGTLRRNVAGVFQDAFRLRDGLLEQGILPSPIKRFAKLDDDSRMATLVAALSLHDAGVEYADDRTHDIGVLVTNENGCLQTNRKFYEDFVDHGRKRGRGSLFVYTLGSMPAAEVTMHFKLTGPTAWIGGDGPRGRDLLERADAMLGRGETEALLALDVSESGGVGFFLHRTAYGEAVTDLSTALGWAERYPTPHQMAEAFATGHDGALAPPRGTR